MTILDQIAQAQFEQNDIRETLDIALADSRWRDVAKYAGQMAEVSEKLVRLQWATNNKNQGVYSMTTSRAS